MNHWAGVLFALLFGLSVLAPQLMWRMDPGYRGIDLMGQDAEEHYIARVNDVLKGNFWLGNTFLADKDKPYLQPPLGEIIQAGVSKLFFVDVIEGILIAKFLFPFLMALAVYALAFVLFKSRIAALLGSASAMLGHLLMSGVSPWLDLLRGMLPIGSYTIYARPINPQISSLIMFVGLLIFYRGFCLRTKPTWWEVGTVGFLTGISLYISPYTFSFMAVMLMLACGWFFITKDYVRALRTLYAGLLGIALLIPFGINYLALHAAQWSTELTARLALVPDHTPIVSIWLVVMFICAVFLWPKEYKDSRIFFIMSVVALSVLTNQHVLSGMILFPPHYHWYITKPLLGIMLGMYAVFLFDYFFKNRYLKVGVAASIIFVLFYTSPLLHWRWYSEHPDPPVVAAQTYAPALLALNTLPGSQTVWADPGLSTYVPIYTKHSAPNNYAYVVYYLNPPSFYESTLFLEYRLAGIPPEKMFDQLKKDRVRVSERMFGLYYRQTLGDLAAIPDEVLADLAEKYKVFYKRSYADIFSELKIDVVVAPPQEADMYKKIPALHPFAAVEGYNIYTTTNE